MKIIPRIFTYWDPVDGRVIGPLTMEEILQLEKTAYEHLKPKPGDSVHPWSPGDLSAAFQHVLFLIERSCPRSLLLIQCLRSRRNCHQRTRLDMKVILLMSRGIGLLWFFRGNWRSI